MAESRNTTATALFSDPKGTVFLAEIALVFQKLPSPFSVLVVS